MDPAGFTQNPFAVLTFIVAPALLTNTSSVLAMSTINRILRTRERMRELFHQSNSNDSSDSEKAYLSQQASRVEKQAVLLLQALRSVYVALGSFAGATLMTLLGAGLAHYHSFHWFSVLGWLGLGLGFLGVGGLILGSGLLFQATQISMLNLREEARLIQERSAVGFPTNKNRPNRF